MVKTDQILNSDSLYTIALFIIQPVRWAEKYGWRCYTPPEIDMLMKGWLLVGSAMQCKFGLITPPLPRVLLRCLTSSFFASRLNTQ